jgi:hypothetical protein
MATLIENAMAAFFCRTAPACQLLLIRNPVAVGRQEKPSSNETTAI